MDQAIGELTNGALLYFARMRSCEYSTTSEKNTRTKRLQVRNIQFYNSRGHHIKKKKKELILNATMQLTLRYRTYMKDSQIIFVYFLMMINNSLLKVLSIENRENSETKSNG